MLLHMRITDAAAYTPARWYAQPRPKPTTGRTAAASGSAPAWSVGNIEVSIPE